MNKHLIELNKLKSSNSLSNIPNFNPSKKELDSLVEQCNKSRKLRLINKTKISWSKI